MGEGLDTWRPRMARSMNSESTCVDCKHGNESPRDEPCLSCITGGQVGFPNWEPMKSDMPRDTDEAPVDDIVVKPSHYTRHAIEPITFIMRNGIEFWRGSVIKYAARAGYKLYAGQDAVESEITDLRKVIRFSEMRINQLKGETIL